MKKSLAEILKVSKVFKNLTTKFYAQDFVAKSYEYVLGRKVDASGKNHWTRLLMSSNSPATILNTLYNKDWPFLTLYFVPIFLL